MIKVITNISYEALLLPHFVKYYRSLGVDAFIIAIDERVAGIWRETQEIAGTLDASITLIPASERQRDTGIEGANKEEIRRTHIAPNDWIIPADLDEFIQFPAPIPELIHEMTAADATFVVGRFYDRIAPDGMLAPTLPSPSIWEQYPLTCRISEMLILCKDHKVTLCRGDCELTSGHHHVVKPSRPFMGRRCVVHHFKWRKGIVEALARRVETYKRGSFGAWPESQRIIDYINANGRIVPADFDAAPGWRPDQPPVEADNVVYTAFSRGYDSLSEPVCEAGPRTAFVAFTEDMDGLRGWQLQPLHSGFEDSCRNAKIHKILPHLYFPRAAYSLWIDASITLKLKIPIEELIATYLANHDIAVFSHPRRKCIYVEAEECIQVGKDDPAVINEQMRKYRYEGYPKDIGLAECSVILRRHTEKMKLFNEVWWDEISRHSRRDQLSFNYVSWKLSVFYNTMPGAVEQNDFFERKLHLKDQIVAAQLQPAAPEPPEQAVVEEPTAANPAPVVTTAVEQSEANTTHNLQRMRFEGLQHEAARLRRSLRDEKLRHYRMETAKVWRVLKPFRFTEKKIRMCRKRIVHAAATAFFILFPGARKLRHSVDDATRQKADYQRWLKLYDRLTPADRDRIRANSVALPSRPLISVIMPVFNTPADYLRKAIVSVREQLYENWELCIADDASTLPHVREILREYSQLDPRIKVVFRDANGSISESSNTALAMATGEFVALLDHDDELAPVALFTVADALRQNPDAGIIYSDYDKLDENGARHSPYFKCDWNPDLLRSHNLICHLAVYRTQLVRDVGGFRAGFEGSQDWDLSLRVSEKLPARSIVHIPQVLYHWREHETSSASSIEAKPYAIDAARRAVSEHLVRTGRNAEVVDTAFAAWFRVRYELPAEPRVSIIVCTRDRADLLINCISSVLKNTGYQNYELIIVDNGSHENATLEYFRHLAGESRVRIFVDDSPFNYSALNNRAVASSEGDILCFLNNDIEVISGDWLTEMVSHAIRPEIGAVGAKLLYPDNTIQHAGVVLGIGGVAAHTFTGLPADCPGYMGRAQLIQNFTVVTAACMVMRKNVFEKVGGFNEVDLPVSLNDVDLCIKIHEAGYHNLWTPYAVLYHHESASRGFEDIRLETSLGYREAAYMKKKWGRLLQYDPAYSPNLSLDSLNYDLAFPPRRSV